MNILMSAYACEPSRGSEHEVAWKFMQEFASQYSHVTVVTRSKGRKNIEAALPALNLSNVSFLYYDLPGKISNISSPGFLLQINAYIWEIGLFFFLLKRFRRNEFDVTQKVTFVSYRFPSFLWFFGKKFVFGPVAGGERFPLKLLPLFSFKGKITELMRLLVQHISVYDPVVLLSLYKAHTIVAVTSDTKSILPGFARKKTVVRPAVRISASDFQLHLAKEPASSQKLMLLFAGRILEWKGILLTLKALEQIHGKLDYQMNIVGEGKDKNKLEAYAREKKLNVQFIGKVARQELSKHYLSHDLFVFPSLHDSGGYVVLEAGLHDLPVLCLDLGGPKEFINPDKDIVISTRNKSIEEIVSSMKEAFLKFAASKKKSLSLQE